MQPRQTPHLPTFYDMKATQQKAEVVELVSLTITDSGQVPREEEAGTLKCVLTQLFPMHPFSTP